jgi:uncharacterized protein
MSVAAATNEPQANSGVVTIVTETRVLPEHDTDFSHWQQQMTDAVTKFPGLIDHQVISPQPPTQLDWVILQKFASSEQAQSWLRSPERQRLLATAQPWFVGKDDIHIIAGDSLGPPPSAVSAVISTKIIPGQEEIFRGWSQRIASAETQYPGFQGHRIDPPIPGVQEDWTTILTFDTEEHLNDWMNSAERQKLLTEATGFTEEMHSRTVRSGFEQWFRVGGAANSPVWKQNMVTLLGLYPVVFLFGFFVGTPILSKALGLPFWLALFLSNTASVVILNWVIPWLSVRLNWWLQPAGAETAKRNQLGIALVIGLYVVLLLVFSQFPPAL